MAVTVSKATMRDCMRRLAKTYEESAGTAYAGLNEEDSLPDVAGMTAFEARKIIITKKIDLTRKKIAERDEIGRTRQGGPDRLVRLNNNIKKMIKSIFTDFDEMKQLQVRNLNKRLFFSTAIKIQQKKEQDAKEAEDIILLAEHVLALENEDKKRFGNKNKDVSSMASKVKKQLLQGLMTSNEEAKTSDGQPIKTEDDLDQLGFNDLPELDISQSLVRVENNKAELSQALDAFSTKVEKLSVIAKSISVELDEQGNMVDDLDEKAKKEVERLENLNQKVEKALEKSGGIMKYLAVLIFLIIACMVFALLYILVVKYISPITKNL
ncbi:syntaxin [Acrasis kona]|uniref:Syntaxin n=1 Tax=Acrasis kona TaxID=1008807 RepID=A0AAW2ZD53_9EUKA